jgi:hypothetical protein
MSSRVRLAAGVGAAIVAVVVGVLVVRAEPVPRTFAYQGVLTDDAGSPITGAHAITIRVFADATTATALCTEVESVTVTNGLFRMTIGDGGCTVDPTWFTWTAPVYLEVTVDTATLSPRTPLLPVASAYQAEHAETAGRMIVRSGGRQISVGGIYCGYTAGMTASLGGYAGAKALCQTVCGDPAAHMCTGDEVERSAQLGGVGFGWFSAGVATAVSGVSALADDCQGWTSSAATSYGHVFMDRPYAVPCSMTYGVACCL